VRYLLVERWLISSSTWLVTQRINRFTKNGFWNRPSVAVISCFQSFERLLSAWRAARPNGSPLDDLGGAIRAVELHHDTFRSTYAAVVALLKLEGHVSEYRNGLG
jgi:hypothetical protein